MEAQPKKESEFGPEYGETFARTTRSIDSDWGCRPFVYREVAKIVQKNAGKIDGLIADIGGGEAKVARDLRDMGITDPIVTFDINPEMVQKAQQEETSHPRKIEILQGDALHIPLADESVKLGLRVLVDGHWNTDQIDQGNKELSRVLVTEGVAIVAIPDPHAYIEQSVSGKSTPGVEVHDKHLDYADNQEVALTLRNTTGRSVNIPAKMHTLERYIESFKQAGLEVVEELAPELREEELTSYKQAWGAEAIPFRYRIFVLKKSSE